MSHSHFARVCEGLVSMPKKSIPYDVQCAIVANSDFETLKIFSLLNKDYHKEACKHLWRSFTFMAPKELFSNDCLRTLEESVRIIMREGRHLRVRNLRIFIDSPVPTKEDELQFNLILDMVFSACMSMPLVTSLDVRTWFHHMAIAERMSTLAWVPRLTSFVTNLHCGNALAGFYYSHPGITSLDLLHGEDSTEPLLQHPLPALETVRIVTPFQARAVRGSPVSRNSLFISL